MSLRETLVSWALPPIRKPGEPVHIIKAAKLLDERLGTITPKQPEGWELSTVFDALRQAMQHNMPITEVRTKYLRLAPWVFFRPFEGYNGTLGEQPDLATAYGAWLQQQHSARPIASMLHVLLLHHPKHLPTFGTWCEATRNAISASRSPRIQQWRQRCEQFRLLQPDGPQYLATHIASADTAPKQVFLAAGLEGELGNGTFAEHTFRALLATVSKEMETGTAQASLAKLASLVPPEGTATRIRFPTLAKELAEALLLPFTRSAQAQQYKEQVLTLLTEHMGDPRVEKRVWPTVNEEARTVILGWLVEQNLLGFFDILTKTADPIWTYRRDFWRRYLNQKVITEAWVILGSAAHNLARQHLGKEFGRLTGASSDQSVLLMRIGGLTVAEWSHSGACRIWFTQTKDTPVFYRSSYSGNELRTASDEWVPHYGSEKFKWQGKVAQFIKSHTGIYPF